MPQGAPSGAASVEWAKPHGASVFLREPKTRRAAASVRKNLGQPIHNSYTSITVHHSSSSHGALKMESSRIFVRGLPPKFSEDDVRKHFSKYAVTDVKFFPHRRIGYVGYKTPEDAAKAVKYFNKSFIRMSKIFVEMARPVGTRNVSCRGW
jgi:RNA recognition motif-containing protein